MSKHTPGPWAQNGTRIESEHEHGWANDGWILAGCEGPDAKANARLMAAAPDLLKALRELESAVDWQLGRSAFTQTTHLKGLAHSNLVRQKLFAAHDAARTALAKAEGQA